MTHSQDHVKRWALLLLLLNLCVFISVLIAYRYGYNHSLLGYIKAFAEAACIGALADWFAVVALFRHPLGVPLPHTAILPAKQAQLANGVAAFIGTHFLDSKIIGEQLIRLQVGRHLHAYLHKNLTEQSIEKHLPTLLQSLMRQLPIEPPSRLIALSQILLREYLVGARLGIMLDRFIKVMLEHDLDKKLVNNLAASIHQFVTAEDAKERIQPWLTDLIQAAQKTDSSWWGKIKGQFTGQALDWVDDWIIEQLLKWLANFSDKVQQDDEHLIHHFMSRHISNWQEQCLSNPVWHEWLESNASKILDGSTTEQGISFVWHKARFFLDEYVHEDSVYMSSLSIKIREMILSYLSDSQQQNNLSESVGGMATNLLSEYQTDIRMWLAEQMKAWSKERLTSALESSIGRDLQYIRINGTLIGGLIGLILFGITQAI